MIANGNNLAKLFSAVCGFGATGAGAATIAAVICLAAFGASAAGDTNAPVTKASVPKTAEARGAAKSGKTDKPDKPDKKADAPPKPELSGAELYAINCNRCHAERYPAEFTDGQWKTLMLHMRVRANLPAKQARLILSYLQDESGHY